jgi:hypothetical protein
MIKRKHIYSDDIADTLRDSSPEDGASYDVICQWRKTVRDLCALCDSKVENFDIKRFEARCGYTPLLRTTIERGLRSQSSDS